MPTLSKDVDVVLGIKEPPVDQVQALVNSEDKKRTWMIFSHTHKGQVSWSLLDVPAAN